MSLSKTSLVMIAAGGSLALIIGAYVFQYLGYAPCKMCYWQRYPHFAAIGVGAVYLAIGLSVLPWLGALATLVTAGLGVFHVGVEQKLWDGPASCTGGGLGNLSGDDLLSFDSVRVVMCDEVSWQLLGISMPGWNALLSFALATVWIIAAKTRST
ncbi:MAG: disulfide bond formation protein B [Pseudomonadota bacterium]